MPDYTYLIIGGGMSADAAARGIRKVTSEGTIGMVSAEPNPPYDRPPLSKGLWKGKDPETIWRGTQEIDAELHLGRRVDSLDLEARRARDTEGTEYGFEKLLLATGGKPIRLPSDEGLVTYYRNLNDYQELRELSEAQRRFAVIGGGFIGSEIAAALTMQGNPVSMVFPEEGIGGRQFPADLARFLNEYYREKGVEVVSGERVESLTKPGDVIVLRTDGGREIQADAVVAGLGIRPNTLLAESAGLEIENGIVVDRALRTSHPSVYAAGDVAAFYNPALDRRIRVEHEDNANTMGEMAGRSMAGEAIDYNHLPYFYSDLFELGYEAVGELDPRMDVVADWEDPYQKGIVYYLESGRVRGVLLWDTWGKVDDARGLIAEPGPFTAENLKGRISAS